MHARIHTLNEYKASKQAKDTEEKAVLKIILYQMAHINQRTVVLCIHIHILL